MIDHSTTARMPRPLPGWMLERNCLAASLIGMAAIAAILAGSLLDRAEAPDRARHLPSCATTALGDIGSCSEGLR